MRTPSWIQECTRCNTLMGRKHRWRPTVLLKTCLRRSMMTGTVKYLWMISLGIDPMNMLLNSKMHSLKTNTGTKRRKETTKGWELLIRWKDGGTDWIALKDAKESYPVKVAEYAVLARISEEPAFAWWASSVLKKRNRIIAKTKSKYWLRTHKFGIEIPKSVTQARQIDAKCGNTLWWDAICKEMKNVRPAFEMFEGGTDQLPRRVPRDKMPHDLRCENWREFPQKILVSGGWPHHRDPSHAHLFVSGLT